MNISLLSSDRNEYIDYLRGIAALSIIVIHTSFWYGQSYTPEWFQNLSLFVDVPFFFYLSGWGSSYGKPNIIKTGKSLITIHIKWIFFVTILAIICFILQKNGLYFQGIVDSRDLLNNYMFHPSFAGFPVIAGSIWFIPYYFFIMIINTTILMQIYNSPNEYKLKNFYMWFLLYLFVWTQYQNFTLGLDLRYFSFYSFFWMLGYNRIGQTKKLSHLMLCILFCITAIAVTSHSLNFAIYDIQSAKFPPTTKWLFVSIVVIFIAKHIETKIKSLNLFLIHIGQNSIFYFFAQGIGSSMLYSVGDYIPAYHWFFRWLITLVINIAITICIAEMLSYAYNRLSRIANKIITYRK